MKLFELQEQNLLTDSELDALYEGVAASNPELQKLIATQLAKPFNKTKQDIISSFVPKLKAWAMDAMNKESDTEFVSKVLNNPEIVAKQLMDNISSRSKQVDNETIAAPKEKQQGRQFYRFKRTSKQ
jgi:hypothetical protein